MFGIRQSGGVRAQATPWGDWGDSFAQGSQTWAGNQVTVGNASQLLTVYGCCRFIYEGISTLPIDVFRETTNADGDVERSEAPKPLWLTEPTVDLNLTDWMTQVLNSLLLAGNAYLHKVYDGRGQLAQLVPMDPAKVSVSRATGQKLYYVNGRPVDPYELLHIKGGMYPGADVGLSPVEAARQSIGAGMAVNEFGARFFGQGATLAGVIEDPAPADPQKARDTARIFSRLHGGNRKAHLPGVLMGGATWKAAGVTQEQAQFLQTRAFNAAEIASHMFLIDPTEFGQSAGDKSSTLTYQNLEQRNARKVQVTFLPWIVRLETAWTALLPKGQFAKLNVGALLRGDTKTRFDTYLVASQINTALRAQGDTPILVGKEMRQFEDLPALDPADYPQITAPAPAAAPATGGGKE